MGLTYTQKGARRYTYYHCARDAKRAVSRCPLKRVPAGDIEKVVLEQLSADLSNPDAGVPDLLRRQENGRKPSGNGC